MTATSSGVGAGVQMVVTESRYGAWLSRVPRLEMPRPFGVRLEGAPDDGAASPVPPHQVMAVLTTFADPDVMVTGLVRSATGEGMVGAAVRDGLGALVHRPDLATTDPAGPVFLALVRPEHAVPMLVGRLPSLPETHVGAGGVVLEVVARDDVAPRLLESWIAEPEGWRRLADVRGVPFPRPRSCRVEELIRRLEGVVGAALTELDLVGEGRR